MANITSVLNQLQQERNRLTYQIDRLNRAISALKGASNNRMGRGISAAGRARIAAAQRVRWAKPRGQKIVSDQWAETAQDLHNCVGQHSRGSEDPLGKVEKAAKDGLSRSTMDYFPCGVVEFRGLPDALGTACGGRVSQLRLYGFRLIVSFVVPQ